MPRLSGYEMAWFYAFCVIFFLKILVKMIEIQAFFLFLILCSLSISIIFEYIFYQKIQILTRNTDIILRCRSLVKTRRNRILVSENEKIEGAILSVWFCGLKFGYFRSFRWIMLSALFTLIIEILCRKRTRASRSQTAIRHASNVENTKIYKF